MVISGGTGSAVVLRGLKKYPVSLSAIVATTDSGGSSGFIRKQFDMISPGDVRQCFAALAGERFDFLNERFATGFLKGHTFGNLLIALRYEQTRNIQQTLDDLLVQTNTDGAVLPMALKPATLVARLDNGSLLTGEHEITLSHKIRAHLKTMTLSPHSLKGNPRAITALTEADLIVVGPGNLYASILPHFLIPEIRNAFISSPAKKIYIANLFTQPGHTDRFTVSDYLAVLTHYIGTDAFTHILYNTAKLPASFIKKYANKITGSPVGISRASKKDSRFIGRALASTRIKPRTASDPLSSIRNPFVHDRKKLAQAIMDILSR